MMNKTFILCLLIASTLSTQLDNEIAIANKFFAMIGLGPVVNCTYPDPLYSPVGIGCDWDSPNQPSHVSSIIAYNRKEVPFPPHLLTALPNLVNLIFKPVYFTGELIEGVHIPSSIESLELGETKLTKIQMTSGPHKGPLKDRTIKLFNSTADNLEISSSYEYIVLSGVKAKSVNVKHAASLTVLFSDIGDLVVGSRSNTTIATISDAKINTLSVNYPKSRVAFQADNIGLKKFTRIGDNFELLSLKKNSLSIFDFRNLTTDFVFLDGNNLTKVILPESMVPYRIQFCTVDSPSIACTARYDFECLCRYDQCARPLIQQRKIRCGENPGLKTNTRTRTESSPSRYH